MPALNIDAVNSALSTTYLVRQGPGSVATLWVEDLTTGSGLVGFCSSSGTGVKGVSSQGTGALGVSTSGTGVEGFSNNGIGVEGGSLKSYGTKGSSDSFAGVYGVSGTGEGVSGRSLNGPGVGVFGVSPSTGVFGTGVGAGVMGETTSGIGVQGNSMNGTGVRGISASPSAKHAGVVGVSKGKAQAGLFFGPVVVTQGLSVIGNFFVGGVKSAAVRFPDGSHRLLYAMESPEAWFEDFGRGKLTGGRARIKLDPRFAAAVRTSDYHVFVTPEGSSRGLYVSARSGAAFDVREQQKGTSGIRFSYRIVARRKDVRAPRFEKITLPQVRELEGRERMPDTATLPRTPAAPRASALPRISAARLAALRKKGRRR